MIMQCLMILVLVAYTCARAVEDMPISVDSDTLCFTADDKALSENEDTTNVETCWLCNKKIAFSAYLSRNYTYLQRGKSVKFDRVLLNDGNGYNPYTGVFRAPVCGVYVFTYVISQGGKGGEIPTPIPIPTPSTLKPSPISTTRTTLSTTTKSTTLPTTTRTTTTTLHTTTRPTTTQATTTTRPTTLPTTTRPTTTLTTTTTRPTTTLSTTTRPSTTTLPTTTRQSTTTLQTTTTTQKSTTTPTSTTTSSSPSTTTTPTPPPNALQDTVSKPNRNGIEIRVKLVIGCRTINSAVAESGSTGTNTAVIYVRKGQTAWIEIQSGNQLVGDNENRFTSFSGFLLYRR